MVKSGYDIKLRALPPITADLVEVDLVVTSCPWEIRVDAEELLGQVEVRVSCFVVSDIEHSEEDVSEDVQVCGEMVRVCP